PACQARRCHSLPVISSPDDPCSSQFGRARTTAYWAPESCTVYRVFQTQPHSFERSISIPSRAAALSAKTRVLYVGSIITCPERPCVLPRHNLLLQRPRLFRLHPRHLCSRVRLRPERRPLRR